MLTPTAQIYKLGGMNSKTTAGGTCYDCGGKHEQRE